MNGELDFEARAARAGRAAEGARRETSSTGCCATRISYMPGGRALVATMKRAAAATAVLVSGGFTAFAARVADDARLRRGAGERARDLRRPAHRHGGRADPRAARPRWRRWKRSRRGSASRHDAGAGGRRRGQRSRACWGWRAWGWRCTPSRSSRRKCDLRVNHGDLTALLYLQGYAGRLRGVTARPYPGAVVTQPLTCPPRPIITIWYQTVRRLPEI